MAANEGRGDRQAGVAREHAGEVLGLVEAARPAALGVDRHGHRDVTAPTGALPAPRQGHPERFGQASLAAILEGVQGSADGAAERGAPLQLEQPRGEWRRQAQRHPGRFVTASP